MSKLTKGPWLVSETDKSVVLGPRSDKYNIVVAETKGYKGEREDNARAIACLHQLLGIVREFVDDADFRRSDEKRAETVAEARKIFKLATGEKL